MKRNFFLIVIVFIGFLVIVPGGDCTARPFTGHTKHKPVVKQSRRSIKRAQAGKTYYKRNKRGNVKRHWL